MRNTVVLEPLLESFIEQHVQQALQEDIGKMDLSSTLVDKNIQVVAEVIAREPAILCGQKYFDAVFAPLPIQWLAQDGDNIAPAQKLCVVTGPAHLLLSGERTALNFLQTLSATATITQRYVQLVAGTKVKLLDTRKTIPGWRAAQKYAVRCGGGYNHRMGLYDGILIKENHIIACGSISQAVARAKNLFPDTFVEVEVENIPELQEALTTSVHRILLDNFSLELLRKAVHVAQGKIPLEASGNITLENIRAIAETGVDYISLGALTKDIKAIDLSMRFKI